MTEGLSNEDLTLLAFDHYREIKGIIEELRNRNNEQTFLEKR